MMLVFDNHFHYVQTIPGFGKGGYKEPHFVSDVNGGCLGGDFKLPLYPRIQSQRVLRGYYIVWRDQGRGLYGARVLAKENQGDCYFVQTDGVVNFWASNTPAAIAWGAGRASDAMYALVATYGPGAILSKDTSYITRPTNFICPAYTFNKQHIIDIINNYNSYEGFEWGGEIPDGGVLNNNKTAFFYRAANTRTLHYIIDARSLAEPLQLKPDMENFGNYIRTYYTDTNYIDIEGTAESIDRHDKIWAKDLDIGNAAGATGAEAAQAGRNFLNSLKIDGIETPPMNAEIALSSATRVTNVRNCHRYFNWIKPGMNICISGTGETARRTIDRSDQKVFLHVTKTTWKPAEDILLLNVNKMDTLTQYLARLRER